MGPNTRPLDKLGTVEAALPELRDAAAAPQLLVCPALPAELWAEVLGAVGASR